MTMTGQNSTMSDEYRPERLVDESMSPKGLNPLQQALQAIKNLILPIHRDLIRQLQTPTPQKVSKVFTADASGNLGGGFANPSPLIVYSCPESVEAWIHRITFTTPANGPANPLKTGEIELLGSFGEVIVFLPQNGIVSPVQFAEGRASAPHINSGESLTLVGDTLPAGTVIRVDLQILLGSQGISPFTPTDRSRTDILGIQ